MTAIIRYKCKYCGEIKVGLKALIEHEVEEQTNKLVRWFENQRSRGKVSIKMFDAEYERLFGHPPQFYHWGPFQRDHGIVEFRRPDPARMPDPVDPPSEDPA